MNRVLGFSLILLATAPAVASAQRTDMIFVPAGTFVMGDDNGADDERPAHSVNVAAFEIDRLPVTNERFAEFLNMIGTHNAAGERLYDFDDADARIHQRADRWIADARFEQHPAVEPTWAGARDYCAWRGKRLPTEAEWEKAARSSDRRKYPWGNSTPDTSRAQFSKRFNDTTAVGSHPFGAGPDGIEDMAGNAWHWVSSAYRPYPYIAIDGRENLAAGPVRATRGGGHDSPASEITTTQRGRNLSRNPRAGHHNISFRCAI